MCVLLGCSKKAPEEDTAIPAKKNDKIITFVTINSPNTYYINERNDYAGLEYDLAKLYVSSLGADYQARFIVVDSFAKVLPAILSNKADIAAADITITENRKKIVNFSAPYHDVQQQVIYNTDITKAPKNIKDLTNRVISVPAGTSFVERLRKMKTQEPNLTWKEIENTSSEQLIEAVANEDVNFTVADSHLFDVMQYFYPNIRTAFPLGSPEKIAWAVSKNAKPKLLKSIDAF